MHSRIALAFLALALACAVPFAGCSSNNPTSPPATSGDDDSGAPPAKDAGGNAKDSSAAPDTGTGGDDSGGSELPDGAVPPQGTLLAPGNGIELVGVTSDGYAIYADTTANTLSAVALDGGAPVKIGDTDPTDGPQVQVIGPVVFNWTANMANGSATLSIWTSAHPAQQVSTTSEDPAGFEVATVSADGTLVAFLDNLTTDGNSADLVVATVGSSAAPTTVVPSVNIGNASCFPTYAFAGSSLVVAYEPAGDAGAPGGDGGVVYAATVKAFGGPTFSTAASLAAGATCTLEVDPQGENALVATATGLVAYPLAAPGSPVALDGLGIGGVFSETDAGLSVLYTTSAGALKRASVSATPGAQVLVASGLTAVAALSPDQSALLAHDKISQTGSPAVVRSDLYLASATAAGAATPLASTAVSIATFDAFTADSSHALYVTNVTSDAGVTTPGLFAVAETGGAALPVLLGSNVGLSDSGNTAFAFATSGSKVVFNASNEAGGFDLLGADTAGTTAPKLLVSLADGVFFLNGAKDKIVYTWSFAPGPSAGLYVMAAP